MDPEIWTQTAASSVSGCYAFQRRFRDMGDTMHALVDIMCDAIKTTVRDRDTWTGLGEWFRAELARLRAINSAAEAERDPGAWPQ